MLSYKELSDKIDAKRKSWFELYHEKAAKGFSEEELVRLQALDAELGDLMKEWEPLHVIEVRAQLLAAQQNTPVQPFPFAVPGDQKSAAPVLSPGAAFIGHADFKGFRPGAQALSIELPGASVKTLMSDAAGFAPANNRMPGVVLSAQRIPLLEDYLPSTTVTERNSTSYMEETTFTSGAAPRAEGAAAGESALAYTQRNQALEIISTMLPVTDQQLSDVPTVQALIDGRLSLMVNLDTETELLTGNGSTPHLQGLLTKSGISTQATGADDPASATYKAMTKVRVTGRARPNLIIYHPDNWQYIRLMKDANGNFIWGPPSAPDPERVWGLQVLATDAETSGTGLVLDTMYTMVNNRQGLTIAVTNSYNDEFGKGISRMRLDRRLNLEIYRAAALCTVTGMPT